MKLPGVHQLTKEQELARSLPLDGQHLVIGGPGTGKSIVALLRVKQLIEKNKDYLFLVFNLLLKHSCFLLSGNDLKTAQWQSWFREQYKKAFKQDDVPRLPTESEDEKEQKKYADFDWDTIQTNIREQGPLAEANKLPYLVIDEGQDMPIQFYQALIDWGFENFFVVADQNQQIYDNQNSSRRDLENVLALETDEVIELKTNHRNHYATACFARAFYTGDPASPPPELPPAPKFDVYKPLLFNYHEAQFEKICQRILVMAASQEDKLIAVITPNNLKREKYFNWLNNQALASKENGVLVSTYCHGKAENVPFDQGGVMVINAQSCKGLEFDIVFMADIDDYFISNNDAEGLKKLFYVMSSRAIDRLLLLSTQSKNYPAYSFIPQDPDVLEVKE